MSQKCKFESLVQRATRWARREWSSPGERHLVHPPRAGTRHPGRSLSRGSWPEQMVKADHLPPDLLPVCDATTSPNDCNGQLNRRYELRGTPVGRSSTRVPCLSPELMSKASRGGEPRPSCCCNIRPAETHLMALGVDPGELPGATYSDLVRGPPTVPDGAQWRYQSWSAWAVLINRLFLGQGALSMSVIEPKRERDARRSVPAWMPLGLKADTDLYDDC